jgi:hypothetical protein
MYMYSGWKGGFWFATFNLENLVPLHPPEKNYFEIDRENIGFLSKRPPFQNPGDAPGHFQLTLSNKVLLADKTRLLHFEYTV